MFGLFKSEPYQDEVLGELSRSRGYWRGQIRLAGNEDVRLALSGGRNTPDEAALKEARTIAERYAALRPSIADALFEHYLPYRDQLDDDGPEDGMPIPPLLKSAEAVWPHATPEYVLVAPMGGALTTEFGYQVSWDNDHTLGARFHGDRFVELCGSTLAP